MPEQEREGAEALPLKQGVTDSAPNSTAHKALARVVWRRLERQMKNDEKFDESTPMTSGHIERGLSITAGNYEIAWYPSKLRVQNLRNECLHVFNVLVKYEIVECCALATEEELWQHSSDALPIRFLAPCT